MFARDAVQEPFLFRTISDYAIFARIRLSNVRRPMKNGGLTVKMVIDARARNLPLLMFGLVNLDRYVQSKF